MIFRKLGIHKNQVGMTMVEVMLVIAISGVISGGITMTFHQTLTGTVRSSNRVTAISQVQHAGYWLSNYAQLAQNVDDNPAGGEFLVLSWVGWDDVEHVVTYTLEDMPAGGLKELKQSHAVDAGQPTDTILARFIDSTETNVDYTDTNGDGADDTVILKITVTIGTGEQGQTEARVYNIVPRPGS
jgi:prepilin-type N-terminal cleavage/methylation domain-containing protein